MKLAIVHDYIKEYGGAERVLEALHEIWPTSPVYTTVYIPEFLGPHRERFRDWDIKTSFLQYIPFKEKLISPFRIISSFVFRTFNLSKYDVVIVSATGAYFPNSIVCHPELVSGSSSSGNEMPKRVRHDIEKRPIHVSYCHTPPRYLYGFATAREWQKNLIFRVIGGIANHFLRLIDFKSAQNVDFFIANSNNVAGRIKKFYRREAEVIYPPVDVNSKFEIRNSKQYQNSKYKIQNSGYFLAGGRLARPKHIDLIVRACRELGVSLRVFGRGFAGAGKELSRHSGNPPVGGASRIYMVQRDSGQARMTNPDLEFVGETTDEEKLELMRNAKAYIFAAEDEDFGITPVEAMSVGTPVIAYKSGGVVESVVHGRTGVFFNDLTIESLAKAIKQFKNLTINSSDCITQAQKFSKERFKKEIKEFVESKLRIHLTQPSFW